LALDLNGYVGEILDSTNASHLIKGGCIILLLKVAANVELIFEVLGETINKISWKN